MEVMSKDNRDNLAYMVTQSVGDEIEIVIFCEIIDVLFIKLD